MKCVVCKTKTALSFGDTCGSKDCRDEYLKAGRGSINSPEYKSYIKQCFEFVTKKRGESKNGNESDET